jgi:G3E family GTPase
MENEYGQNNLDAKDLEQNLPKKKEIKILEFMEGCVCCTMKDSFRNSVLTVFCGLEPEFLIVEPTGVGRLSSILNNLKPIVNDKISLLNPIVVLSPRTYSENMAEWPQLYTDQVANAGVVVFSKCEHEDPAFLDDVTTKIRSINPNAEIVSEHYSQRPDDWWRGLVNLPELDSSAVQENESEVFSQLTLTKAFLHNPSQLVVLLEDCLRGQFGHIVRAKGTIPTGDEMLRFDLADRQYAITGSEDTESQVVFIGTDINQEALCRRLNTFLPYSQHTKTLEQKALRSHTTLV